LTATLLRGDHRIEELQFYIGPKLYEESWSHLTEQGYLAKVTCYEVRVSMTPEFAAEYANKAEGKTSKKDFLYNGNPNKFKVLQY